MMRELTVWCLAVLVLVVQAHAQDAAGAEDAVDEVTTEAVTGDEPTAPIEHLDELKAMTFEELLSEARRLIDNGEIRKSIPYVQMARVRDDANPLLKALRGEVLLSTGNIQEARPLLMEAYHADSNDFRVNYALGRLYLGTRSWRQAYIYLEHAEALAPLDKASEVQRMLAEAYRGAGKIGKAAELARRALEGARGEDNEYDACRTLVMVLLDGREFEASISQAERLVELAETEYAEDPGSLSALKKLSDSRQVLLAAVQTSAVMMFAVGPDGVPTDEPKPGMAKDVAERSKRVADLLALEAEVQRLIAYHEVIEIAKKTTQYDPENADYQRDLGLLLVETSQFEDAIEAFEKALELNPEDEIASRNLAWLRGKYPTSQPAESVESEETTPANP